jgi:hypothetical protein
MPTHTTRGVAHYKVKKTLKGDALKSHIENLIEQKEALGLIQGKEPGSLEEWRVAKALMSMGIEFQYQYAVNGGNAVRGGQIVDFMIYNPFPVALQVFGNYWHSAQATSEDNLKLNMLAQLIGSEPLVLWGIDLATQAATNEAVRRVLK